MNTFSKLGEHIRKKEDWLIERVIYYAKETDYVKYTSTLIEAWRASIVGLSQAICNAIEQVPGIPELHPDHDLGTDPITSFGIQQAKKHRRRGITLEMFLGLMKYYRQAYLDSVIELQPDVPTLEENRLWINRFFDRTEIGFCSEWYKDVQDQKTTQLAATNRDMTNEKNKYLTLFQSQPDPSFLIERGHRISSMNQAATRLFDEMQFPASSCYAPHAEEITFPLFPDRLNAFESSSGPFTFFEYELPDAKGSRHFDVQLSRMLDVSGKFEGTVVVMRDITDRKKLDVKLSQFSRVVHQTPASVVITDCQGNIEYVNPAFTRATGYTMDEARGKNPRVLKSGYMSSEGYRNLWETITLGREWRGEFHNKRKNGELFWEWAVISPLIDEGGHITHYMAIKEDITARKMMEEQLRTAAQIDKLTGLPNRALLNDRLQQALFRAKRMRNYRFAVLFLDFDRFKIINDSLGHEAGDLLLIEIAQRLKSTLRAGDTLATAESHHTAARLGGDEFVILLDAIANTEDARQVADRLLEILAKPYLLKGHEIFSTASIGIVTSDMGQTSSEELLRDADMAMYEAKMAGRGRYALFDEKMRLRVQQRLHMETDLRKAIEQGHFFLEYQPIISLSSGEMTGVEALLRWKDPNRGIIPPAEFIPIAEETGLILQLGRWVMREACHQLAQWQREAGNAAPSSLSINISPKQITEPGFVEQVAQIMAETGVSPHAIHLEITESTIMHNVQHANEILRQIKCMGVALDMDDFGTGYSSLSCLHQFPLDVLKIDRSFVANMDGGKDFTSLVNAIVTLAHNLGMTVIAEGVETAEQVALLQSLNVQFAQGFFFSKPLPASKVLRFRHTQPHCNSIPHAPTSQNPTADSHPRIVSSR